MIIRFVFLPRCNTNNTNKHNKLTTTSIARAQQQLRWATVATIDMGHKMGVAVSLSRGGSWVPG